MKVILDFETRSVLDLKSVGPWVYAEHAETDVLCMALKSGSHPAKIWFPDRYRGLTSVNSIEDQEVARLVESADEVEAHNAEFEMAIWKNIMAPRYGWPVIPNHKWRCSAAMASACALPRSLEKAVEALGLPVKKDMDGRRLMLRMCRPGNAKTGENPDLYWNEDPEDLERVFRYCMQDVETAFALSASLPSLNPTEQRVWVLNQKINERGIFVDNQTVKRMIRVMEAHETEIMGEMAELTDGWIQSVRQTKALADFCGLKDVRAETVADALDDPDLSPRVRRLLEIRKSLSKSSTAKYRKMMERTCLDGRLRGELMYHGASTGRFSGRGVQVQNLPRESVPPEYVNMAVRLVKSKDRTWIMNLFGDPMHFAKQLLRPMIIAAPGYDLIAGDYSQIEARVVCWLGDEKEATGLFREGKDIYCDLASKIYEREITKADQAERQIGKIAILALGFGMGPLKFLDVCSSQAKTKISMKFAREVVKKYRDAYPGIKAFWRCAEEAALLSVRTHKTQRCGLVAWSMEGDFLKCTLPSGRKLSYPYPQIEKRHSWIFPCENEEGEHISLMVIAVNGITAWSEARKSAEKSGIRIIGQPTEGEKDTLTFKSVVAGKWVRDSTFGGKLVENITQAVARDVMVEGMLRVEEAGYPVILSVHDEIVSEIPQGFGSLDEYLAIMSKTPRWAIGLPVSAEGWRGERYRK